MNEKKGMKALELGATGRTVARNVKQFRESLNLTYAALEKRLEEVGHRIPSLGLRRIEAEARKVDVDELFALAHALDVKPASLLLPESVNRDLGTAIPMDANFDEVSAWVNGPLTNFKNDERRRFWHNRLSAIRQAVPEYEARAEEWARSAASSDDPQTLEFSKNAHEYLASIRAREQEAIERVQMFPQQGISAVNYPWNDWKPDGGQ